MFKGYLRTTVLDLYDIEKDGSIYSLHENHYGQKITPHFDKDGYPVVTLCLNGIHKKFYIHRLLAQYFIPNPDNKPQVNHINGDKRDYSLSNLEWVTPSENMQHAVKHGLLVPPVTSKKVIDTCTGKQYSSLKEAAADLNINYNTSKKQINGLTKKKTCLQYVQTSSQAPTYSQASYSEI